MKIFHHKFPIAGSDFFRSAKTPSFKKRFAQQGILLIDCLMYVSLFFVISGIAFTLFYSCWDNAKNFRRNSDDIVNALKAGERWRADIRTATAPLRVENSPAEQLLLIPQKTGEIDYRFSDGTLWRRTGTTGRMGCRACKSKIVSDGKRPSPTNHRVALGHGIVRAPKRRPCRSPIHF